MTQPPQSSLTLPQVKQAADRLLKAGTFLRGGGFHGQGVARAYYAVFLYTRHLLAATKQWPEINGRPLARLPHSGLPDYVELLYNNMTPGIPPRLTSAIASLRTDVLQQHRIKADYYGHQEISEKLAQGLIFQASEILADLRDEADRLEGT